MAAEITVFEVEEAETTLHKSQKQLIYEELEQSSHIDKDHVWSLYDMDEYEESHQKGKSTLPSIMLKYVLDYCKPIVVDAAYASYSISLQNELIVSGVKNDRPISIPSGTQFKVIGLLIPSVFVKSKSLNLAHYDYVSDEVIMESGRYGVIDRQTDSYTQQRPAFTHPGLPNVEAVIKFTDDAQTLRILESIISYIKYLENYYLVNYPLLKYDITIQPSAPSYKKWLVINGRLDSKELKTNDYMSVSNDLLKVIGKVHSSSFGTSFFFDAMYMLDANKLMQLYNLGNNVGVTDSTFKKEVSKLEDKNKQILAYQKQINIGHKLQLEIIKKKSISFEKFGETNLSNLSKKQLDIVNLEYKKLESTSESGEKNRSLFSKVLRVMLNQTPDDLRKVLNDIEKYNKNLDKFDLLDGGVCPHVYQLGKKTLENFKNSDMLVVRDWLIEKYSLPADPSGYFCKVCGGKLSDFDTTSALKFAADRGTLDESPLQTMIWKEAMYIVSNNVRFITPVPIRPLINSLASGLKDVVAHEEAKLYRSKTNTGENIKDTLNLYACIYIYAALCALMLQNPGKLLFAREPPADKVRKIEHKEPTAEEPDVNSEYLDDANVSGVTETKTESFIKSRRHGGVERLNERPSDRHMESIVRSGVKSKSSSNSSKSKTKLSSNKSGIKRLRYKSGGKVVTDSKVAEKFYLTTALKLILISKETVITRLKNMSVDLIKQIFLKSAYSWAIKHARPIHVDEDAENRQHEHPIGLEAFYKYTYYAKKLGKKSITLTNVHSILEREESKVLSDIKNDINIYATVTPPEPWHFGNDLYDDYTYRSYLSMLEYYKDLVYTKSYMPKHVQVTEYLDKYKDLLDIQFKLRMSQAKLRLRPNLYIELATNLITKYNNFAPSRLDLAQHYCPTGELHKVGSFIYTNGSKTLETTKKEVNEWLNTNNKEKLEEFDKYWLINERCERCKNTIHDAKSGVKSDKALASMFKKIDDIDAFYKYYETRCPKGSLHNFIDGKCSACKFLTDYAVKKDSAYYSEYSNIFSKVQLEKQALAIKSLELLQNELPVPVIQKPIDYKYSLKSTAEWSQIADVKYNILVNIGLFEKLKFSDIESATINPSKTAEPSFSRAMRYKNHIHNILREYNLLLNHESIVDLPLKIKELIDVQRKVDLSTLNTSMPSFNDFHDLDIKHSTLGVADYINFLQEYLARIFSQLDAVEAKYKPLASSLIKYFTKYVIDAERFVSKPEPVFAKVIFEDASDDENSIAGDDQSSHSTDVEDDVDDAAETNDISNFEEAYDVEDVAAVWETE